MEALLGIGGVLFVLALFGGLSRIEAGRRRRMIADVSRPREIKRYDLVGDLLPREETSLGPVSYERLPSAQPSGYVMQKEQARHAPTLETGFVLPMVTALGTSAALTIAALALSWAFDWSLRTVAIAAGLSFAGAWFWRLGWADRVLWSVESWTGKDIDHDHNIGNPALQFAVVNPARARDTVARQTVQNDTETRTAALQRFCDVCFLKGTSEGAHGIEASGPDRDNYVTCRDTLIRLGLAAWKHPDRPRGGWRMVADPATAKAIVSNHVA